jgi:hypothetical protein
MQRSSLFSWTLGVTIAGEFLVFCGRGSCSDQDQRPEHLTKSPIPARAVSRAIRRVPAPDESQCAKLATRYQDTLSLIQTCETDADCVAETRGTFWSGLDGCGRYRRADAELSALASVATTEQAWLDHGCAHEFITCRPVRAQCAYGLCAERPPDPCPPSYRRVWQGTVFSFFVPRELEKERVMGTDSIVGRWTGPRYVLDYDFGQYSNSLRNEPDYDYLKYERRAVTIGGLPAAIVHARARSGETPFRYGVYFAQLPPVQASYTFRSEGNALSMIMDCKTAEDCAEGDAIFRSIEFH